MTAPPEPIACIVGVPVRLVPVSVIVPFGPAVESVTPLPKLIPDPDPAVSVMLPADVVEVDVIDALSVIVEAAFSVSELPLAQVTAALTVIVPAEPPDVPLLVVVIVMLPPERAAWRSVFRMFEVAAPLVGE